MNLHLPVHKILEGGLLHGLACFDLLRSNGAFLKYQLLPDIVESKCAGCVGKTKTIVESEIGPGNKSGIENIPAE